MSTRRTVPCVPDWDDRYDDRYDWDDRYDYDDRYDWDDRYDFDDRYDVDWFDFD